ncbi:MAG: AEC family transporter [Synergistaceae bacterium]|nr:AEC family transporter [Synergistaceae bacterium]MBQ9573982.1 AEC family transporter [Synergistaceae bacterium]
MNLDFFTVASNLISLFFLIAAGFIAVKTGVLKPEASLHFSSLLLMITLPCTIFTSLVQREYDPLFVKDGIITIVSGIVLLISMLYISRLLANLSGVPKGRRGIWAFVCTYSNSGFMGFPIALSLFGNEGLALAVMFNIAFNLTLYTLGAIEIIRDNPDRDSKSLNMKAIIFSNINIATVLSLIFYFGRIKVPSAFIVPVKYLSDITTPISMLIIGIALAHSKASDLLTDIHTWTASAMRLLVYPLILCGILKIFPLSSNPLVAAVLVLINAMPGASVTAVLCKMYHSDIDFAARSMFIQNLACMVTIPLVCTMI